MRATLCWEGFIMENFDDEFKTGCSTTIPISAARKINEFTGLLQIKKTDVVRRIILYFLKHHNAQDLKDI